MRQSFRCCFVLWLGLRQCSKKMQEHRATISNDLWTQLYLVLVYHQSPLEARMTLVGAQYIHKNYNLCFIIIIINININNQIMHVYLFWKRQEILQVVCWWKCGLNQHYTHGYGSTSIPNRNLKETWFLQLMSC